MCKTFNQLMNRLAAAGPSWEFSATRDAVFAELGAFFEMGVRPECRYDLVQNPNPVWEVIYSRLAQALREVDDTRLDDDRLMMWQMYNAGMIIKNADLEFGVDLVPVLRSFGWADTDDLTQRTAGLIDFLLITHHHPDHYDRKLVSRCLDLGKPVIVPETIGVDWENESNLYVVRDGDELDFCDVQIKARRGYHVWRDTMEELPLIYYEVTTPAGRTLMFAGDADYTRAFSKSGDKQVDVLFLPWRYPSAMYEEGHEEQTATIIDALNIVKEQVVPRHIVLEHYAELEHVHQFYPASYDVASRIKKEAGVPVEWLFWGEGFRLL